MRNSLKVQEVNRIIYCIFSFVSIVSAHVVWLMYAYKSPFIFVDGVFEKIPQTKE